MLAMRSYACADASCSVLSLIIHTRVIMLCAHYRTETDAESPALDSAHGSEALSAGSKRWPSALALSAGSQRMASARGLSAAVSQRWLSSCGSHDDRTATMTKTNNDDNDDEDNDDDDENDDDDDDDDDDVDKGDEDDDDDRDDNNDDDDNGAAGGDAAVR